MKRLIRPRDALTAAPLAVLLGAGLASIQPGDFWRGTAGMALLLLAGLIFLMAAIRWSGAGRLMWVIGGLALGLRILVGTTLYVVLPVDGYDEPDDRAGFVFTDAHRRDDQAWEVATSGASILTAFDRSHFADQYGGLLALSALSYRTLSPDSHRPLLILALASLVAALGVPIVFRIGSSIGGARLGWLASWFYCLYPESILTGGAQMREPFLLTFIAMAWWGFLTLMEGHRRSSIGWLAAGFGGLVLTSPGIALASLVFFGVWAVSAWTNVRLSLPIWIAGILLFLAALIVLAWSLSSRGTAGGGPVGIVIGWFRDSVNWVIYQLERGSGQVQNVFSKLFPAAQFVFVVGYGVTQPLLPPAFFEPTTFTWHVIAVLRSAGWYIMLPLLLYAPFGALRTEAGIKRRLWIWMIAFSWIWIMVCSIRAGGDQWDNPRYRLIFFAVQAIVSAAAWFWWRASRDHWLPRIVAAEIVCVLLFGQWYVARYYLIGVHLPILLVVALAVGACLLILVGGALWDQRATRGEPTSAS